jgi:D-threo-aldose 1-dehydrogenase
MLARFASDGAFDCFLLAGRYTLLEQGATSFLDMCAEKGIDVICGGVFNSGLLADPRPGATYDYAPAPQPVIERAIAIRDVCGDHGVDVKTAALRFPLMHPAVTTVLTGARTPDEIRANVECFGRDVPSELWDELRSIGLMR